MRSMGSGTAAFVVGAVLLAALAASAAAQPPRRERAPAERDLSERRSPGAAEEASLAAPRLVVQTGHARGAYSLAPVPGRDLVASSGRGDAVHLWELDSGSLVRILAGSSGTVAVSPDGALAAATGADGRPGLWRVETGEPIGWLPLEAPWVRVAFSPDGRMLLTGAADGRVQLWDVAERRELGRCRGHTESVDTLAFSRDGRLAVTASRDRTARVWSVADCREVRRLDHPGGFVGARLALGGTRVVIAEREATRLWDVATGRELWARPGGGAVAVAPDGVRAAVGGRSGPLRLFDLATGGELGSRELGPVRSLAFVRSGGSLLVGLENGPVVEWDLASGEVAPRFAAAAAAVGTADLSPAVPGSPGGRYLAVGLEDSTMRLWDLAAGQQVERLADHEWGVGFAPDGRRLLVGATADPQEAPVGAAARVLDLESGATLARLPKAERRDLAFLPDGGRVAIQGRHPQIWTVAGERLAELRGSDGAGYDLAVSPDGRYLATGGGKSADGTFAAHVYDLEIGAEVHRLVHPGFVSSVAFSPDGRRLLTGGGSAERAYLWEVASGRRLQAYVGHGGWVTEVAFSPAGDRVLTGSTDAVARLWDAASGRLLQSFEGHTDKVTWVGFHGAGRAVTAGGDQTVRFWDAAGGGELCRLVSFLDGSWAVVDPAGRYDASHGGDVGGLVWAAGVEVIELEQLKELYYEPGLLAKILGFDDKPPRDVPPLADVELFPSLAVDPLAPDDLKLRLALEDRGGGIGQVLIKINGKLVTADARGAAPDPGASHVELEIDLSNDPRLIPGYDNEIEVVAYNAAGYLSSRGQRIRVRPPGAAPLEAPTLWALVAGVSDFEGEAIDLRFAAKDARDMATAVELAGSRLFGPDRVRLSLLAGDDAAAPGAPTKENLRREFERLQGAQPGDVVFVYLAGHGVAVGETYGFLTADARSTDLSIPEVRRRVAITSQEMIDWLRRSPSLKQVMVLDTCAAGAAAASLVVTRSITSEQVRAIERLKDRTGFHVLMGSAADAVSYEASRFQQGLLTYALLQGMQGAALDEGQFVDVSRLFQYAADEVPRLAREIGGIQRPRVAAPRGTSFPIGQLTADDRQRIPLAVARTLLLPPILVNALQGYDDLELMPRLRRLLREASFAGERGGAAPAVYVDAEEMPGALRASGTYEVAGGEVTARVSMVRDGARQDGFELAAPASDLDALAARLADEILRLAAGAR